MIPILLYHQIADIPPDRDPKGLSVPPAEFERQMRYLAGRGYRCLSLRQAVDCFLGIRAAPTKAFVITFDDGFRDLLETAAPILERYDFTATTFFVTGRAGRLSDWDGQSDRLAAPLLRWSQVRQLAVRGITFASHTVSHPRLSKLDPQTLRRELDQSKKTLEDQLGQGVDLISYPYGDFNEQVLATVRECGYRAGCGVDRGRRRIENIWRSQCGAAETHTSFLRKINGWHQRYVWFREQSLIGPPLRRCLHRVRDLGSRHSSDGVRR